MIARRGRSGPRAALVVAVAAVLALASALGAAARPAQAATPDLALVTTSQYEVLPDEGRVAISIGITASNRLQDTVSRQYYFDRAYLAVIPGTSNFRISSPAGSPKATIESKAASYWLLRIDFPAHLDAGKSMTFQLTMDLRDPGGSPTRPIRVGTTLVSFPIWAYGTAETPGSSVAVTFPPGYEVAFDAGKLSGAKTEADGRRTWSSGMIADPLTFYAYVVADRPGAYAETTRSVPVGESIATLRVRAWPDDPDFAERVGGLFERGLPVLGEQIGLPWPRREPLIVQEAVSRSSGGYAGLFDAAAGKVEVAYYAGSLVVLHEAAHGWFNGALLADRWANEAFASWYALSAATALDEKVSAPSLTPALTANAIPLNAWGAVGETSPESEDYAYAASLELARRIAERAGPDGLRVLWTAAASGEAPYQPTAGPVERVETVPDWRSLLDLLERDGQATYEDLWLTWVTRPQDEALLEARSGARAEYMAVVDEAGAWQLPRSIRDAMGAWQFEAATAQLAAARTVLEQRAVIDRQASSLGTAPPVTLRQLFEESGALERAVDEANAERSALGAIAAAVTSRPDDPGIVESVGLLGTEPEADLAAARNAFSAGDLTSAEQAAGSARFAWLSADSFGRARLTSVGLLVLAGLIAIGLWLAHRRRARIRASLSTTVLRAAPLAPSASGTRRPRLPRLIGGRGSSDSGHRR